MWDVLVLLGAPGSGKGTTAGDLTAERPDWVHLSTGDMLREAIKSGSPVGLEAKQCMEQGQLVPDEVVMKIVSEHLESGPADAVYLFDGFPRTDAQAQLLDDFLESSGKGHVSHVFLLEVPEEVLVDRIAGRLICRDCGKVFHRTNMPPTKESMCDDCSGDIYQRPDDNRETVLNRLKVFHNQTASLIDYYGAKKILHRVDCLYRDRALETILTIMGPKS